VTGGFVFTPATREQLLLRLALVGVSGAGKTYSAIGLATYLIARLYGIEPGPAMQREIAVIDTERGSSRRYAAGKPWHFSVLGLESFSPEKYIAAVRAAEDQGFRAIVIDSLSHEWAGTDGLLEQKDRAGGANSFAAWGKLTPRHNALIEAIVGSKAHVIATMRAKQFYEQGVDADGKKAVKALGMGAVQREGIEYEFDIVLDIDLDNAASVRKSRCVELAGRAIRQPGKALAEELGRWLLDGEATAAEPQPEEPRKPARAQPPRRPDAEPSAPTPPTTAAEAYTAYVNLGAIWTADGERLGQALRDATTLDALKAARAQVSQTKLEQRERNALGAVRDARLAELEAQEQRGGGAS